MKRIILIVVLLIILAAGIYVYKLYTGKVPSLTEIKTDASISAVALISAFEKDSASANKSYLGKIIEVSGMIKSVDAASATLVLGDTSSTSSVRCSMDTAFVKTMAALNVGSAATIKGACTGYMPDETGLGLGADVVLNRGVLQTKN